jgi:hypothetical protein
VVPPVIISASRRTDIPAFFPAWFAASLDAGEAVHRQPYSGRTVRTPIGRSHVAAFVFWTRNPRPFLPILFRLEESGYPSIFQVTVTGLPRTLEPSVPPFSEAVAAFRELSGRIGPARVLWRFDPLLPGEDQRDLAARFDRVSGALRGHSVRCTLSLARPYRKSLRATRHLPGIWEPSTQAFRDAVLRIGDIGRSRGFDMRSCGDPLLPGWGLPPAACVDAAHMKSLYPGAAIPEAPGPTRPGCLCAASRDIGAYRTCRHGCLYCYAA